MKDYEEGYLKALEDFKVSFDIQLSVLSDIGYSEFADSVEMMVNGTIQVLEMMAKNDENS